MESGHSLSTGVPTVPLLKQGKSFILTLILDISQGDCSTIPELSSEYSELIASITMANGDATLRNPIATQYFSCFTFMLQYFLFLEVKQFETIFAESH